MVANSSDSLVPKLAKDWRYILDDDGNPMPMPDLITWAEWYEQHKERTNWIVAKETIGAVEISTVFLGLDHNYGTGPPLLFETMCFTGKRHEEFDGEGFFDRYATREEAAEGHRRIVELVRATVTPMRWWKFWRWAF